MDLENRSSFSAPLALPLLHPSPEPAPACVTHINAVLASWSRGSLWSRRALWSNSLKGLGKSERKELIFASEETRGLDQKAMAKSHSLTQNLHPLPRLGGLKVAPEQCKALWKALSTSPAPCTGGLYWESKLVTGQQRGLVV